MFHSLIFPYFKASHKIARIARNTPYDLDEDGEYLISSGNVKLVYTAKALAIFDIAYCILVAIHLGFSSHLRLDEKLQGIPYYACYIGGAVSKFKWTFDNGGIQILNSMMKFEREVLDEGTRNYVSRSKVVKTIQYFVLQIEVMISLLPFPVLLLTFSNPCIAPFTASMWPDCRDVEGVWRMDLMSNPWRTLGRIGMALFDSWVCADIFSSKFVNLYIHNAFPSIIVACLRAFEGNAGQRTAYYAHLEILVAMMNDFAMKETLPIFMAAIIWCQIVALYACIVYHEIIPYPAFLIFLLLALDATLFNTFIITLDSLVFKESSRILEMENIEATDKGKDKKVAIRKVSARQPIRIKFGQNFIDGGTPLAIQDFCMNQLANLILISK